jgi:hypothetical protein
MKFNREKGFKILYVSLCVSIALLILSSCATTSFKDSSFKALNMAASTYEGTMETIGDAYKKGMIDESTKENIIKKADVYWKAYHSSVIIYEIYIRQETPENKQKLVDNLDEMNNALIELLEVSQTEIK